MWCEAGYEPDSFWRQTPRTFQIVMKAARSRNEAQADMATVTAYQTAVFNGLTKTKRGLGPLKNYLPKRDKAKADGAQMLGAMKLIASRVNRIFKETPDG